MRPRAVVVAVVCGLTALLLVAAACGLFRQSPFFVWALLDAALAAGLGVAALRLGRRSAAGGPAALAVFPFALDGLAPGSPPRWVFGFVLQTLGLLPGAGLLGLIAGFFALDLHRWLGGSSMTGWGAALAVTILVAALPSLGLAGLGRWLGERAGVAPPRLARGLLALAAVLLFVLGALWAWQEGFPR